MEKVSWITIQAVGLTCFSSYPLCLVYENNDGIHSEDLFVVVVFLSMLFEKETLEEWRCIRHKQDLEYEESLKADQEKASWYLVASSLISGPSQTPVFDMPSASDQKVELSCVTCESQVYYHN